MKKFNTMDLAAVIIWLLPVAYLFYVYPTMPNTVPVHFGINGTPDRYGSRSEFLIGPIIVIGVSLLVYLLLKFLPAIDPKKQVKVGEATFQKIALAVVLFLAALNIGIILSATDKNFKIDKAILPAMGLFFAFMGNIMNSIKPNYFAGIRTPWALEDPNNWRVTHRLAGKLWFAGGILLTIAVLFLPTTASFIVFMSMIAILVFIPVIYSFVYFKKHQPK